jgi:hypothetical protein
MRRVGKALLLMGILLALPSALAASEGDAASDLGSAPPASGAAQDLTPPADGARKDGLEHLVPELAADPYKLEPGARPFLHRLSFSPAYGSLGSKALFAFRIAYNPNPWLGYEWAVGHNPGEAVHAVLHSIGAIVRHPLPGRLQPYLSGSYGMVMVLPGQSINADPVTKNALTAGGGLECYIRSDLAVRADMQYATVFGRQKDREGVVVYDYLQQTIGLAFYRSIRP